MGGGDRATVAFPYLPFASLGQVLASFALGVYALIT